MRSKKQYRKKMNSRKKRRFRFFSAGQGTKRAQNPLVARPPPTIDELLRRMEEGESYYKPKTVIRDVRGMPLLEKYMSKTENDRRLEAFHDKIKKEERAYKEELEARDKYLKENPMKVNESQESWFSHPEKVGPQRDTSYRGTRGVEFNLEGKEPERDDEYGYYALDFRGGKKNKKNKTKKRRQKRR